MRRTNISIRSSGVAPPSFFPTTSATAIAASFDEDIIMARSKSLSEKSSPARKPPTAPAVVCASGLISMASSGERYSRARYPVIIFERLAIPNTSSESISTTRSPDLISNTRMLCAENESFRMISSRSCFVCGRSCVLFEYGKIKPRVENTVIKNIASGELIIFFHFFLQFHKSRKFL